MATMSPDETSLALPPLRPGATPDSPDADPAAAAEVTEASRPIAEEVTLLFEAAFARFVAIPGLNFHVNARLDGLGRERLAEQFLDSDEYARINGDPDTLTNRDFVESLFRNILKREGAGSGIDNWTGRLDDGALTRAQVLLAFAQAGENRENTAELSRLTVSEGPDGPQWVFDPDPNLSETIEGTEQGDFLRGLQGDDTIRGFGDNDVLWGGPGDDRLEGGGGNDVALYRDPLSALEISGTPEDATVTGPRGTDTLVGIERLRLPDGDVALADLLGEDPSTVAYTLAPAVRTVTEGEVTLDFTLSRTGETLGAESVFVSTVAGTAGAADFTQIEDLEIAFDAGQTEADVSVTVLQDELEEGDESFELVAATAPGGDGRVASATVTIEDDGDMSDPGGGGGGETIIPLVAPGTVAATDGPDVFTLRVETADAGVSNPDFTGTARISGFDPAEDTLRFLPEDGTEFTVDDVLDENGISVLENPFDNSVTYVLALDEGLGEPGALVVIEGQTLQSGSWIEVA